MEFASDVAMFVDGYGWDCSVSLKLARKRFPKLSDACDVGVEGSPGYGDMKRGCGCIYSVFMGFYYRS